MVSGVSLLGAEVRFSFEVTADRRASGPVSKGEGGPARADSLRVESSNARAFIVTEVRSTTLLDTTLVGSKYRRLLVRQSTTSLLSSDYSKLRTRCNSVNKPDPSLQ